MDNGMQGRRPHGCSGTCSCKPSHPLYTQRGVSRCEQRSMNHLVLPKCVYETVPRCMPAASSHRARREIGSRVCVTAHNVVWVICRAHLEHRPQSWVSSAPQTSTRASTRTPAVLCRGSCWIPSSSSTRFGREKLPCCPAALVPCRRYSIPFKGLMFLSTLYETRRGSAESPPDRVRKAIKRSWHALDSDNRHQQRMHFIVA